MYSWVGAYVSETTRCILVWLFTHVTSTIVVELYGIRHYTIGTVVTCSLMEEISLDIFSVPMWRNNRCYPTLMFLIDVQNGTASRCIQPFMEISLKCKVLVTNEVTSKKIIGLLKVCYLLGFIGWTLYLMWSSVNCRHNVRYIRTIPVLLPPDWDGWPPNFTITHFL